MKKYLLPMGIFLFVVLFDAVLWLFTLYGSPVAGNVAPFSTSVGIQNQESRGSSILPSVQESPTSALRVE